VRRIAAAGLAEVPGTRWRYSIASDVLGAVSARAAGEPLPDAVRRLVTALLGMADTGFSVTDPTRVAVPYAEAQPAPVRMGEPPVGVVPEARLGALLAVAGVRPHPVSFGRRRHGRQRRRPGVNARSLPVSWVRPNLRGACFDRPPTLYRQS
jgi:CubicO group peptidase (beta-lactamase class C family)